MKNATASPRSITSAAIVPTLGVMVGCFALATLVSLQAQPGWWGPQGQGAVLTPQVVTNGTIVTTNYVRNDHAVANQGQLKKFTVAAVNQLNTTLANSGGAGPTLSNMVYNWHQDYLTNGYATNTASASYPYKPADRQAVNVGQLKYIASLVYGQLASAGYSGLYPSWIAQNTNTDNVAANLGQLKQVFNFDLSVPPAAVGNLALSANNANELDLSWTLPAVNNASSIQVAMSADGGTTWTTTTLAATATSYAATGLTAGQSYLFQVTAGNSAGSTAASTPSPVTASAAAPAIVSATLGTNNTVNLSWSESNTNGVGGFSILQSTNGGVSFAQVDAVGSGATSDTLHGLSGAMDTSQFEVKAAAGSSTATSSPAVPVASTNDTDGDGTNDNVDGWAGFTDKTQEVKLAPPRVPNPTYVAVTISTIPNTNPDGSTNVIDFVNHSGQAVVEADSANPSTPGSVTATYSFWDKGATNGAPLLYPPSMQDPSWGTLTVQSIQPMGLGDDGTVIGYAKIAANSPNSYPLTLLQDCEESWRWNKTMIQPQWLAEMDNLDEVFNGSYGAFFIGWYEFLTTPTSITFSNGVETIYAYHQEDGGNSNSTGILRSYTEVYSSSSSYQPTRYYATDNNAWNPQNDSNYLYAGTYTKTGSHESRTPALDNGNGTVIGYGAEMDSWTYNNNGNSGSPFDLNAVIPSNLANSSYIWNLPLEPQPGNATAPPGGGMIVNTANGNNYRQWINGTATAVNSGGYVLGMQNSTTPTNPTANAGGFFGNTTAPYYSYTDPASVPFPTIWAPQTSGGNVTGYTPVTLTMPQAGMSFKGNAGMFLNKNLQIAGGFQGDPNAFTGEDTPFLCQNYQYHHLNDFFPALSTYSKFKVTGLDDNGTITAIATPSTPANANQQILQLIPAELAVDVNRDGTIVLQNDATNPVNVDASGNPLPIDITSQAKPFQFWLNDDQDNGPPGASLFGNEVVPVTTPDSQSTTITSVRDLEDWTRLWIYTKGLNAAIQAGTIKVGLKWKNITRGTPTIRLEKAEDTNGGLGYLGNLTAAKAQASMPTSAMGSNSRLVTPTGDGNAADYVFDSGAFSALSESSPKTCLLFSGVSEGTGELVLVFLKSDGTTEVREGGQLWLDLRDIKEMYIRELAQPQPAYPYSTTSGQPDADIIGEPDTLGGSFVPNPNEGTSNPTYVVFVHGFNMDYTHSTNYAETFFKRLWQLGYKGRFASFRWPTYGTGGNLGAVGTYNDSEYVAWNSGSALKSFVHGLSGYHIDVVGHSMGNMAVGEALREGMAVDHYAMLHAASSASCYDDALTSYPATNSYTTPDTSSDPPTRSLGYSYYLGGVLGGLVNFDDPGDSTIVYWWNANNSNFKPQHLVASGNYYSYTPGNASGNKLQFTVSLGSSRPVATFSEAAAYVDQSLTGSIGSNTGLAGSITANISESAMGDSHSYEWDNPICDSTTLSFYTSVMGRSVFNLSPLSLSGP